MNKLLKYIVLLLMCGIGALCHGQAQLVESGSLDMVNMGYDSEQYKHLKAKDTLSVKEQANDALLLLSVNVDSAEQSLKTVLYKSIYLQYHNGIAMAYTNLGYVQSIRGNYHAAIAYYNKAKPYIITGFHNRTSLAMFYSSYASPYYHLSQYDSVFHYAELAISVIDTLTDFNVFEAVDVASVYNNIALLWTSVGDLNAAHAHLIKALTVVDAIPQKTALLQSTTDFVLQNLADWYLDKIQLDSAKHYLDRLEKEGNKNVLTSILLSQYYAARQDTTQAIALLENTLKSTTYTHTYQNDILALTLLGIYYFDQGNTTQAQAKLLQAIAIIKNKGDVDMVSSFTAYDRLARIAALQKDYALAYSYQQKSYEILSDIKIKEKRNAVYALQAAVNKSKRDQIIADKEWALALSQYRLQKSYIIIGVVILIIVLGTMVAYLLYRSAQRKQQLKWQQVQQEKELVQLKAIMKGEEQERARIAREIHDGVMVQFAAVKMNLQNIPIQHQQDSVMSYVQSPYFNNIVSQLDRASQELRMTSHHLMPDYLLQSGLVEALYYFCNNITKHQNITLSFQWHGELLPLQQEPMLHIYRIVQELMQNIIKHAQAQKVLVQILSTDDGWLTLTIEDDGVGYQTQNTAAGMGLNNLEKRVQLLNGKLDIKSTIGEGTSVYIELDTLSLQEKNPE